MLPHKVKIKPKVWYSIVWVDKFDDGDVRGYCDFDAKQIVITREISQTLAYKTFIHEFLHAIEFEYSLKFPHPLIYALEEHLYYIFKNNFSLTKFIKTISKKPIVKKKRR